MLQVIALFKQYPLLSRLFVFIILPIVLITAIIVFKLSYSVSDTQHTVIVNKVEHKVSIALDERGVPFIEAQTDRDAFFTLGFLHARDRLWQLTLQQRLVQGRLAEVFGKSAVNSDIWIRTLGLYGSAEKSVSALSPAAKASLDAYSEGINYWIDTLEELPPEFTLLGIRPESWRPRDSVAWIKLFALNLSGNMWEEIARLSAKSLLTEQQQASLFPAYPAEGYLTIPGKADVANTSAYDPSSPLSEPLASSTSLLSSVSSSPSAGFSPSTATNFSTPALAQQLQGLQTFKDALLESGVGGEFVGSNAWVVSGKYTQSGKPMLANDPHLELQLPSLWYAASLKGDELSATGMTLVGLPLVIFGRNEHIAWGGTNMMLDNQDLVIEQSHPNDPTRYRAGSDSQEWLHYKERVESIYVKAESPEMLWPPVAPVTVKVRETIRGPVISDSLTEFDQPVSLQWTASANDDTSYESFLKLNYANNWQAFKAAFTQHIAPALNMLYIDEQNIGYLAVGQIPLRQDEYGNLIEGGRLPRVAWQQQGQWKGFIPAAEMPQLFNPDAGVIVSANNKIVGKQYPYPIAASYAEPARAQRIADLLQQAIGKNHKLDSMLMAAIQADELDLTATVLSSFLAKQPVLTESEQGAALIGILEGFDGDMSADSQGGVLLHVFARHLRQRLYQDEVSTYWQRRSMALLGRVGGVPHHQLVDDLSDPQSPWCDNIKTTATESCTDIINLALQNTLAELDIALGDDPDDWRWGDVHFTRLAHRPFSDINMMDTFFEYTYFGGGTVNTVNASGVRWQEDNHYESTFGAGFRQVIDMAGQHSAVNSTGQSGNRFSPHYLDQVDAFARGELYPLTGKTSQQSMTLVREAN